MAEELESENEGLISLSEPCLPAALEDVAFLGREECEQLPAHLPLLLSLFRFLHRLPSLRRHVTHSLYHTPDTHLPFPTRLFSARASVVTWLLPDTRSSCTLLYPPARPPASTEAASLAASGSSTPEQATPTLGTDPTSDATRASYPILEDKNGVSQIPDHVLVAVLGVFGCPDAMALVAEAMVQAVELPALKALDLEGCGSVLTATVARACQRFHALQRIDIKGAVLVTDEALRAIARYCPRLETLQIGGCSKLSNEGVVRFIGSLRKVERPDLEGLKMAALMKLSLMNCSQLTNTSLSAVAELLPGLRDLCIYGCYRMTDDALIRFKRSHNLSKLNTSGCYKITDMGIRYLMQVKPTLLLYHKHRDFYLPLTSRDLR